MMQSALSTFLPLQSPPIISRSFKPPSSFTIISTPSNQTSLFPRFKKAAAAANDTSTVDYSATTSVFPAEAFDTLGGEACEVDMYPEAKLNPDLTHKSPPTASPQSQRVEREYLEYNSPKTVFQGDACDELGGEFCQPEYQSGP